MRGCMVVAAAAASRSSREAHPGWHARAQEMVKTKQDLEALQRKRMYELQKKVGAGTSFTRACGVRIDLACFARACPSVHAVACSGECVCV